MVLGILLNLVHKCSYHLHGQFLPHHTHMKIVVIVKKVGIGGKNEDRADFLGLGSTFLNEAIFVQERGLG